MRNLMYDLIIGNGTVVFSDGARKTDLFVKDGKIVSDSSAEQAPEAVEYVNAEGLYIFPGCVDAHCHIRDPGRKEREDFWTGTQAAAAGGITTICEMPISIPPVYTGEILRSRAETVQPESLIDFALYGAAGYDNIDEIQGLADAGAVAFKTYLHPAEKGRENEFTGLICPDEGTQYDVMKAVAATGRKHSFHCENNPLVEFFTKRLVESGKTTGIAHALSRPSVCEDFSVASTIAMAASLDASITICHMSSPTAVQLVKEAKARGVKVSAETCPPYLFMDDSALEAFGPYAKNNPPLRSKKEAEGLWQYIEDGTIDFVATDHSPWRPESKTCGLDDIFKAYAGMPGFDLLLPSFLDAINRQMLSFGDAARLLAEAPAKMANLTQKGSLAPGYDADFVIVDMNKQFVFDKDKSHSKAGEIMLPHHGRKFQGAILSTWLRGIKVQENGVTTAQPGTGQFVLPSC